MTKNIKHLIDEGYVGFESYPSKKTGGQTTLVKLVGFRFWFPKDSKEPDVDIRIRVKRSQLGNKNIAQTLFELALEEI